MNAMGHANLRCPIKTIKGAAINGISICRIGKWSDSVIAV